MLFPVSACRHPGLAGLSEASFLEYFGFTLCRKRGYKRRMSWRRNMSEWIGANSQWERGCRSTGWLYHCTALLALADFVMFLLLHHLHRMQKSKKKKNIFSTWNADMHWTSRKMTQRSLSKGRRWHCTIPRSHFGTFSLWGLAAWKPISLSESSLSYLG